MHAPVKVSRQLTVCSFFGWPAIRLQQGKLTLHVVPQIGGRLMGIRHEDDEICFINPALAGKSPGSGETDWKELCGDWDFPLWGGGKTWIAPESQWPGGAPHADLDSGAYTIRRCWLDARSMGVEMESPICCISHLQIKRRIELFRGSRGWRVTASVSNRGSDPCECGVWDVLMLNRPASVCVTLPPHPNGGKDAVHPFAGKGALGDLFGAGVIGVEQNLLNVLCNEAVGFKVGALSDSGEVKVSIRTTSGSLLYRRCTSSPGGMPYAHGHPIEVFNAPLLPYFEVESHSPLTRLLPGKAVSLVIDEQLAKDPLARDLNRSS